MLTLEQVGAELTAIGINKDIHIPKVAAALLTYEMTGSGVTSVRRADPPTDGDEPTEANQCNGDTVTETTVVFTLTTGEQVPYRPGAASKKPTSSH